MKYKGPALAAVFALALVLVIVEADSEADSQPETSAEAFNNPYQSRGASLLYSGPSSYHAQSFPTHHTGSLFDDAGPARPRFERQQLRQEQRELPRRYWQMQQWMAEPTRPTKIQLAPTLSLSFLPKRDPYLP